MNKPYIICHMMSAVDGRIDCGMTEKIQGVKEYYATLNELKATAFVSGKVTAELEMALPGKFQAQNMEALSEEGFSKKGQAASYNVVVDTQGALLWKKDNDKQSALLIITSEKATKEYLAYLDDKNISWIACGKEHIDLVRASEILHDEFGVERMAIVGGGHINAGFLDAGLLDEVSVLLGPAIDGRGGMAAMFDGLPMDREPFQLQLESVKPFADGAILLRYKVK